MEAIYVVSPWRVLIILLVLLFPVIYTCFTAFTINRDLPNRTKYIILSSLMSYGWVVLCIILALVVVVFAIEDLEMVKDIGHLSDEQIISRGEFNDKLRSIAEQFFKVIAVLGCIVIPLKNKIKTAFKAKLN